MRTLLLCFLTFTPLLVSADSKRPWEVYWDALMDMEGEDMAAYDDGGTAWELIYDRLCELEEQPIDINSATREQFEELPFLTARQVEDICEHLYFKKGLRSKGELMMIPSLDYNRRKLLECFIYIAEKKSGSDFPALKDIARYGRHELTAMGQIPFYERAGDKNGYLGYPYKHWVRYNFTHSDRVRLGVVASQDAGEPFFTNGNNPGYDYYSVFLQLKKLGRIKNLIVGRYRASFGMGLVVNTGFSMGKQMMLSTLGRPAKGFTVHSSRSELGYFQGAAATIDIGRGFTASAFVSYRNIDATLNKTDGEDGSAKATIATIISDGYHRTPTEMSKKGNAHATAAGVNIGYQNSGLHVGMTAMYTHFDRDLRPKSENTSYRKYYPSGNDFVNVSMDYAYNNDVFSVRGETALNRNGNVATINMAGLTINDDIDVMLLHRYYSHRYTAIYAQSFTDGTRTNNEHGIYGGLTWRLSRQWSLAAYSDFVYFYWPKYLISRSSWSSDNSVSATFSPTDEWSFDARYRLKIRQRDNEDKSGLIDKTDHRVRLSAAYHGKAGWRSKTLVSVSVADFKQTDRGIIVSQSVGYTKGWLSITADAKYFHTDGYDARVYAYEPGMPHSFYFPAYYGHGIRYSATARADISRSLRLIAKLGTTNYFNRPTISSGLREINASSMTDAEILLRWRF